MEIHLKTLKFAFEMFFALLYNVSPTKYFALNWKAVFISY